MSFQSPAHINHEAGPSRQTLTVPSPTPNRKASRSVSSVRPPVTSRTPTLPVPSRAGPSTPFPSLLSTPIVESTQNVRAGLKRRISTPALFRRQTAKDAEELKPDAANKEIRVMDSRARSTSTSLVVPDTLKEHVSLPKYPDNTLAPSSAPPRASPFKSQSHLPPPSEKWSGLYINPASPEHPDLRPTSPKISFLSSAQKVGKASVLRIASWIRPKRSRHAATGVRRGSEDSEKGLDTSGASSLNSAARPSEDSIRRDERYWSRDTSDDDTGYFSLPPTPPSEKVELAPSDFSTAFQSGIPSLPTPALSTRSLSRSGSKQNRLRETQELAAGGGAAQDGWLRTVESVWVGCGTGKTGVVLRELGWTVAVLVGLFFASAIVALWLIRGLPITTLKHWPSSTTDLQLLSAEVRSYMMSSSWGWWHTISVLTFVGCWKHAWSVPGAVVLNILVGSVLDPVAALTLLTIITASGSLFCYLLSRPLAPLIAVLFPKPLALVRAALAPTSLPSPTTIQISDDTVTAIHVSADPASAPIGGTEARSSVWRRLLIMRAMGFVPWSGMNVACGVVGVDWKTFWLTTAVGSASWSYVTASVGNILSCLALPNAVVISNDGSHGESLTSLLRDPVLIFKLAFLSALTLLPVILKRRTPAPPPLSDEDLADTPKSSRSAYLTARLDPPSPAMSPLSQSLARFTPTPAVFDLLSFGRTAARQGGKVVLGGVKSAAGGAQRLASSVVRS